MKDVGTNPSAPDFAEPILGFRAWTIDMDGLLRGSAYTEQAWAPGENRAECQAVGFGRLEVHSVPGSLCTCGFHAFHSPSSLPSTDVPIDQVIGAIAAWGEVEVYRAGFRSRWATVIALAARESNSHRSLLSLTELRGGTECRSFRSMSLWPRLAVRRFLSRKLRCPPVPNHRRDGVSRGDAAPLPPRRSLRPPQRCRRPFPWQEAAVLGGQAAM